MADQQTAPNEIEQNEGVESGIVEPMPNNATDSTRFFAADANMRKERRKAAKKEKRKQKRREIAEHVRREEEARLQNPDYLARLQAEEEMEKERVERELREFEEREKKILEDWEVRRRILEEEASRRAIEEDELLRQSTQDQNVDGDEVDEDGWEYVEVGPPEIIWQGNEIIVRKKKIKVKKKDVGEQSAVEDSNRPTSNPLPPQSEAFIDYQNSSSLSAKQLLESVAQETPNFGTEQDKAHCPFHLKTGACRFGTRCSRIHFYPDKSCTLLIKNMYNGPGLAWEQDEGLECTDEEVERAYEEFYEDVHTEFLKFGEIVNFKVCRNGSSHLRGNVYVHYKSIDSACSANLSVNGRYFAGKQVHSEFVSITRWKVAICGEFMKSKLQTCSRGMACNFIHCFRNPGGDYEWADLDKPPPRYWVEKMAALFGYSDEYGHDERIETPSPRFRRSVSRISKGDVDRYRSWRSRSRDTDARISPKNHDHIREQRFSLTNSDRKHQMGLSKNRRADKPNYYRDDKHRESASNDSDSNKESGRKGIHDHSRSNGKRSNRPRGHSRSRKHRERSSSRNYDDADEHYSRYDDDDYNISKEYPEDKKSKRQKVKVSEESADDGRVMIDQSRSHACSDSSRFSTSRKNGTQRRESDKESPNRSKKSQRRRIEERSQARGDNAADEAFEERGRWVPENHSSPDD